MAARLGIKVVSSATSKALTKMENRCAAEGCGEFSQGRSGSPANLVQMFKPEPFLRIPPFPGANFRHYVETPGAEIDCDLFADRLKHLRIGGTFWGAQPPLPADHVLVRSITAADAARKIEGARPIVLWDPTRTETSNIHGVTLVSGPCDPWHMLAGASALVAEECDEVLLIASLLGVPCYDVDRTREVATLVCVDQVGLLKGLCRTTFENPFTGEAMNALQAAELCGFWRGLIDSNRGIAGGIGFAFWKQDHVEALLWGGSERFRFLRSAESVDPGVPVAVWRSRAPSAALSELQRKDCPIIEIEDGFLRSRGLGADCVPPLSITVDRLGAHFDPSSPSELEVLLERGNFDEALVRRASALRRLIIEAGIGKYDRGTAVLERPAGNRRHVLVTGQVEDDRAVVAGGCGLTSNLELLARVRGQAPDAYILYKPHPDVVAGHRRGEITQSSCLCFADEIVGETPIASLIAMVDEVHVNTSLAGFEALLRDKPVTTYGVPFYAGWGLTKDLGPVPKRRTAKRTLDELAAAALLLYPRYLDPLSGLPCPAETIVSRLSACEENHPDLLVGMRRLQGRLMRRLRRLVQ